MEQPTADSSLTETLYCLICVQWLGVVDKIVSFPRCSRVSKERLETSGFVKLEIAETIIIRRTFTVSRIEKLQLFERKR